MPQTKILLDTNSYLRLAKSIHPLLFACFGSADYCLYVLQELDVEISRSRRLQTKFNWVGNAEYVENRSKKLALSKAQKANVAVAYELLWDYVVNNHPGPSKVDCKALAHAHVLEIRVVTDDEDMRSLAEIFSIETLRTLDLLKIMLDCGHVSIQRVRQIAAYWNYEIDLPKNFRSDYAAIFGETSPI